LQGISLADIFFKIARLSGLNVIDAASTKPFGFMKFLPGPGLGGHCIPLDPHYLSWKMRTLSFKTRMIELASEINSEMPLYTVEKIGTCLNKLSKVIS
jgi:UDP-N-acetyl-D-glucosamine dehydrogenase